MYIPTKEEWGLLFYGGPLAIIFTRKNITKAKKIHEMRRWFVNEFGVFERDSETEYRHGKQLISIYNSHGKTLDKNTVQKIERLYVYKKDDELIKYLYDLYPETKKRLDKDNIKIESIFDLLHEIAVDSQHEAIDIDTDKYMPTLRAYNPKAIKQLIDRYKEAKKETEMLSPLIPKQVIPMVYMIGGIMVIYIVMQSAPKYIRELAEWLQHQGILKIALFLSSP